MNRFRLLGMAFMAMLALGAFASATAFAEESGNPQVLLLAGDSFPITFTATSGEVKLVTSAGTFTCKTDTVTGGSITGPKGRLGTIKSVEFKECESSKVKCNTTGDKAGIILLTELTFHLVAILVKTELEAGIVVLLPKTITITCGILKLELRGSVMGLLILIKPTGGESTTASLLFNESGNVQQHMVCELPKEFCEPGGKKAEFLLEANSSGKFEEAVEVTTETLTFSKMIGLDS